MQTKHYSLNGTTPSLMASYTYDDLGRLKTKNTANQESSTYGYNIRGWMTALTGNNYSVGDQYAYNANGNMIKDLNKNITNISYNYLNLSKQVDFVTGDRIINVYDASGVKHQMRHYTATNGVTVSKEYLGNKVYENGALKMILTEDGYVSKEGSLYNPYYYVKDHLGSNRAVINVVGTVVQSTDYYPFGLSFAENPARSDQEVQGYKYNGKELDKMSNINTYDYGARMYDPAVGRFSTMDPMAEKYYNVSPYAYCGNNPVNRIDPTGMDWYTDKDGSHQYDPELTKKNQSDRLQEGQAYVGVTHKVEDNNGNIENYRKDGSIMYFNEESGYKRMWNNTQKTGNEEMGVMTDNGVLVLPSHANGPKQAEVEDYNYSWSNGKLVDAVDGKTKSISGTIHTHPTLERTQDGVVNHSWMGPSGEDYQYFGDNTPGIPFFVITADMRVHTRMSNASEIAPLKLRVTNGVFPTFEGIMFGGYPLSRISKNNKR